MAYNSQNINISGGVLPSETSPLVYTQNNAPAPSGKAFSDSPTLTIERMQEVLSQPQTTYIYKGKITHINPETGEVFTEEKPDSRAERWALKAVVNKLLPRSRISRCHKWVVPNSKPTVYRHVKEEQKKAFFGGLEVCANVWACPVCAAKISERRREELKRGIEEAKAQGLAVSMLTLTVPHKITDDLRALLDQLSAAQTKLWKDKAGKTLISRYAIEGRIRALEVTYGDNGFHPHMHILLFTRGEVDAAQLQRDLYLIWRHCCVSKGLDAPSLEHGVRVDVADEKIGDYVSKWGLDSEMTKGHVKRAKHGYSMNDLLRAYLATDDKKFSRIWLVFFDAFKGRRQLVWSKGLKARLLLQEQSDEELATAQVEEAELFAELTLEQWKAVYRTRSEHYVLKAAEQNPQGFDRLIEGIVHLSEEMRGEQMRREMPLGGAPPRCTPRHRR